MPKDDVMEVMKDGKPRTVKQLSGCIGIGECSVRYLLKRLMRGGEITFKKSVPRPILYLNVLERTNELACPRCGRNNNVSGNKFAYHCCDCGNLWGMKDE